MAPSALILSILEQAKEPLLCLNGAGYFSEEEWIQLDLIVNKKYVWTTGPERPFHDVMKDESNANKLTRTESVDSSNLMSKKGGIRISPSSSGTSLAPSLDGVGTSNCLVDFGYELSPTTDSPAPVTSIVREKTRRLRGPRANGFAVRPNPHPVERLRTLNSTQTKRKNQAISPSAAQKGIEAWASAPRNGIRETTHPTQLPMPSETLVELNNDKIEDSALVSKRNGESGQYKDVNTYETNNAAEWDEEPVK